MLLAYETDVLMPPRETEALAVALGKVGVCVCGTCRGLCFTLTLTLTYCRLVWGSTMRLLRLDLVTTPS